jgi:hypothetical protein
MSKDRRLPHLDGSVTPLGGSRTATGTARSGPTEYGPRPERPATPPASGSVKGPHGYVTRLDGSTAAGRNDGAIGTGPSPAAESDGNAGGW